MQHILCFAFCYCFDFTILPLCGAISRPTTLPFALAFQTRYYKDCTLASQFDTILFADDTFLALSDNNLSKLQSRVNIELRKIDLWTKKNKLHLNYLKTHYLLFDKQLSHSYSSNFNVSLNLNDIKRIRSVKYLGIYIDENLNWARHIQHLSLQLARYCGLIYRIRRFLN